VGFFSNLFGKKEAEARQLNHPNQLIKGDMLSLDDSFALPSQLRGQQFRVEAVNTYEYEGKQEPEWVLKGQTGDSIFMGIEEDDETYIALSIKVNRTYVEQIFDLDQFSTIFDEAEQAKLNCLPLSPQLDNEFSSWLSEEYHQIVFSEFGYFHREDYRNKQCNSDSNNNSGDAFEAYQLIDNDESKAIDIEVYEGGSTDVMLTIYRPLSDIRDYWPGS